MPDGPGEVIATVAIGGGLFLAFILFVLALIWGAVYSIQDLLRGWRHRKRVRDRQARRQLRATAEYHARHNRKEH